MFKKIMWAPVIACTLATATPALTLAHTHAPTTNTCACPLKITALKDKLHLTDEQIAQIKAIKATNKTLVKENIEKLHAIRSQLHKLMTSDHLDEAKVDILVNEKAKVLATMMKTRVVTKHKIYAILTPEQKQQFAKMLQEKMQHH